MRAQGARAIAGLGGGLVLVAAVLYVLAGRAAGLPPLGTLLDPADGLYRTARQTVLPDSTHLRIAALERPVTVVRDERGVPHLFAESDRDAVIALGFVVAQDRLFQMDFIARVAAGRLAEALGPSALETDRFLRRTGMDWGARRNLRRIRAQGGIELDLLQWYAAGVNAYLDGLDDEDLPFAFRLLGYRPMPYTMLQPLRMLQYMTYDLTFGTDDASYALLRRRLGEEDYDLLYPRFARLFVPIIPQGEAGQAGGEPAGSRHVSDPRHVSDAARAEAEALLRAQNRQQRALRGTLAEGFISGKGSNNWAVSGARSATGAPLLAGDMHLALTLPSVWYEAHLVTPTMNAYGVTIPGAPLLIEGLTEHVGWTFTNTGADQIDHLALELDETGRRYRYEDGWRALEVVPDTIPVKGEAPVIDTFYYAHWGPVLMDAPGLDALATPGQGALALNWVAHDSSRSLAALWGMHHAEDAAEVEAALRYWDTPMQNILYATSGGAIAIRSTGYLPLRQAGHGAGLLDGTTGRFAWIGRVPFEELPHARDPARGYLTSTNQQPTDSTYRYYLGHNWRTGYRSLRIDALLRRKPQHTVEGFRRYQADVHAVQRDLFVPLLDTLAGLSHRADTLRQMLRRWNGATTTDRPEPLVLDAFLKALRALTWDEPAFEGVMQPQDAQLLLLLTERPASTWLDVMRTPAREDAPALLRLALEAAADTLAARYGWGKERWRWGEHHKVLFPHLTRAEALRALWRGPFEYPGFEATLSPAGERLTTHSASWRMIVDFSQTPPKGYGVYPGGQSGNPFSARYDAHLPTYLAFDYYELYKPPAPQAVGPERVLSRLVLLPEAP